MNIPDLINGAFELTGGFVCWLNVRRLLKDRTVQGVDWRVSAFFSSWGFWNLAYYPSLHQWASFAGGVALVIANTTWVFLALRIIKAQREYQNMTVPFEAIAEAFKNLPEIRHTYKCECDLCQELDADARGGSIS